MDQLQTELLVSHGALVGFGRPVRVGGAPLSAVLGAPADFRSRVASLRRPVHAVPGGPRHACKALVATRLADPGPIITQVFGGGCRATGLSPIGGSPSLGPAT